MKKASGRIWARPQRKVVASSRQPAADLIGERLAELPNRLVAHFDAPRRQQLIDVAQAQGEAEIEPDGMADDLGREPVAGVVGEGGRPHPVRLPDPPCPSKPLT